jgi:hypothetical protein
MNYLSAKQRGSDSRWDYTYNGSPWGYCRAYSPIPDTIPGFKEWNEKVAPLAPKFHTDGHATEEEACECYKQYLLDTALRLQPAEPENAYQQHRCKVCHKFTACYAQVGAYRMFVLCPEHQTRAIVAGLLKVGESWES